MAELLPKQWHSLRNGKFDASEVGEIVVNCSVGKSKATGKEVRYYRLSAKGPEGEKLNHTIGHENAKKVAKYLGVKIKCVPVKEKPAVKRPRLTCEEKWLACKDKEDEVKEARKARREAKKVGSPKRSPKKSPKKRGRKQKE